MVTATRSTALARLLEQHRQEAERLRLEQGDPVQLLGAAVRNTFEAQDLEDAFRDLIRGVSVFDRDEIDETDER